MIDLTTPPSDRPACRSRRIELLSQQLERIDQARRLGWRIADIKDALCKELGLGDMTYSSFSQALHKARLMREGKAHLGLSRPPKRRVKNTTTCAASPETTPPEKDNAHQNERENQHSIAQGESGELFSADKAKALAEILSEMKSLGVTTDVLFEQRTQYGLPCEFKTAAPKPVFIGKTLPISADCLRKAASSAANILKIRVDYAQYLFSSIMRAHAMRIHSITKEEAVKRFFIYNCEAALDMIASNLDNQDQKTLGEIRALNFSDCERAALSVCALTYDPLTLIDLSHEERVRLIRESGNKANAILRTRYTVKDVARKKKPSRSISKEYMKASPSIEKPLPTNEEAITQLSAEREQFISETRNHMKELGITADEMAEQRRPSRISKNPPVWRDPASGSTWSGRGRAPAWFVAAQKSRALAGLNFKPLRTETRSVLTTEEAAAHLNCQPQTLRKWAMNGEGPIQPIKVGRRLGWPVAGLRKLVGV